MSGYVTRRKRPAAIVNCIADKYVRSHGKERIVEIAFTDGTGCLVSLREGGITGPTIEVYRTSPGITVLVPSKADVDPSDNHRFKTRGDS